MQLESSFMYFPGKLTDVYFLKVYTHRENYDVLKLSICILNLRMYSI